MPYLTLFNYMENLHKIVGTVISVNEPKLSKSGTFRYTFIVSTKIFNKNEWFVMQYFNNEFPFELKKEYTFYVELKGIKVKDIDTGEYRFFNAFVVSEYE